MDLLHEKINTIYPSLIGKQVELSWIDKAGDNIKLSTNMELEDALKHQYSKDYLAAYGTCTFEFSIELAPARVTSAGQVAFKETVPIVASPPAAVVVRKEFPIFNYSNHVNVSHNPFPNDNIGKTLFPRKALSRDIIRRIDGLLDESERGYYIFGQRASGKTTLLRCLAKLLQDRGETVYYVTNAVLLDKEYTVEDVKAMGTALLPGRHQYIFVDDIQKDKSCILLNYLLKVSQKSFTIGFGLSCYSGLEFHSYLANGLALTSNDITNDEEEIRPYFTGLAPKLTQKQVDDVLNWCLLYTGGLLFPFVKLCHHFLNDAQFVEEYSKCGVSSTNGFIDAAMTAFISKDYRSNDKVYSRVISRSYTYPILRAGKIKDRDAYLTLWEAGVDPNGPPLFQTYVKAHSYY